MTEPTPETTPENVGQATEPTMVEVPSQEQPDTEVPVVENAPGYLAVTTHYGQTAASIVWGPPNEGPADGYTVEAAGKSLDVGGDIFRVDMGGLTAGQAFTATVTARIGNKTGSLTSQPVLVDQPVVTDPPQEG